MKKILLVEDNELVRTVVQGMLQSLGLSVILAKDGLEALNLLASEDFSLLITDIKLPIVSGYEVLTFAKESLDYSLPVLVISGREIQYAIKQSFQQGADDFLLKPIRANCLYKRVRRMI